MGNIADFLNSILYFFGSIAALLINLLDGTAQLLSMIPSALGMVSYSISTMPTVLIAFATGFISISVAYLIIGR